MRLSTVVEERFATVPVLILAGGLGSRLRSAYAAGPKVMAPINGRPFLAYVLRTVQQAGLRRIILCVGYKCEHIEHWLSDGQSLGIDVKYSQENEPLGTAGALRLGAMRFCPRERFFAVNGDSILHLDFRAMLEAHDKRGARASIALANVQNTSRYGSVDVDAHGNVRAFGEKSGSYVGGYINGGVYLFEPEVLESIPDGCAVSLEREVLPVLASRGLVAFMSDGYFIDIGVPEDFLRAQSEIEELLP